MSWLLEIAVGLSLSTVWFCALKGRRAVSGTTLLVGWGAVMVTLIVWTGIWLLPFTGLFDATARGHLWYAAAIVALSPSVAVLGARRPIARVWPWFVLLPLLGVFGLPSAVAFWTGSGAVHLAMPTLMGFGFVVVMGAGNYLLTRHTFSALAYALALWMPLLGLMNAFPALRLDRFGFHFASILLAIAVLPIVRPTNRTREERGHQRVWTDFCNWFGVVWAKRVMDRINWTAAEENWPLRLGLFNLHWTRDDVTAEEREHALARLAATFRWLLKRFVDDAWIESRLTS